MEPEYSISNSEIQSFKDCRRKWYLSYYRRLSKKRPELVGPLPLGTRVHESLEYYYRDGIPLLEAHEMLVRDAREIAEASEYPTTYLDSEAELGRRMLEGYLEWIEDEGIDSNLELISAEEVLTMPLFDGKVELKGKIDQRVRRKSDGARMFRDFKTVGGSFDQFKNEASKNEQIMTYMLLELAQNRPEDQVIDGGIFTLLRKVKRGVSSKPPFYDQYEVRHNKATLDSFWIRIHGTVGDIMRVKTDLDNGADHRLVAYPSPSRDCSWKCPFVDFCPMFDDGSDVERAMSDLFEARDPYDYYKPTPERGTN